MTNTLVMSMTWMCRPGSFVSTVIDFKATKADRAMVTKGIRASSGER